MWAIKSNAILIVLVSLATLAMIGAWSVHIMLADPQHCDQSGWPSCHDVGYHDGVVAGKADGAVGIYDIGDACAGHSQQWCIWFDIRIIQPLEEPR
jgi:hypothetical protein